MGDVVEERSDEGSGVFDIGAFDTDSDDGACETDTGLVGACSADHSVQETETEAETEAETDDLNRETTELLASALEDAYDALLRRGITAELVPGSPALLMHLPVHEGSRGVLACDEWIGVFARFERIPGGWAPPRVALSPEEGTGSAVARYWRAFGGWPAVSDTTGICYVKALMMSVRNDLEVVFLAEAPGLAAERVRERLSVQSENYAGVFQLPADTREVGEAVKEIVAESLGVLGTRSRRNAVAMLADVLTSNLRRLGERCYLCGARHRPAVEAGVPMPCCNDLCRFRSCDTMYVNLYSDVKRRPLVVQLLMRLALSAVESGRGDKIFNPAPPGLDLQRLGKIISKLPPMDELSDCTNEAEVKDVMRKAGRSCYEVLWWIIMNIPNHIAELPPDGVAAVVDDLRGNPAPGGAGPPPSLAAAPDVRVFKVASQLTSLNRLFLDRRRMFGYAYAFHGSRLENWYSLLKHGARNMSGQGGYQLNGAAHGPGVYLGLTYDMSAGYARGGGLSVVAVCEVVRGPEMAAWHKGSCLVVPQSECVSIKYLIVKGLDA